MKETLKKILRAAGWYHPLQTLYRQILFIFKRTVSRISYAAYKGAGFTCNVCGNTYTKFIDDFPAVENRKAIFENEVIAGYGKNILCPYCLSNARERLVIEMLKRMHISGKKILHLSPEKNVFYFLNKNTSVTTADLMPSFYKDIDKNISQQDATHFSYKDETFDLVIANHILEHIPDDVYAMKEIFRVLKNGGQAILQVPYSKKNQHTSEDKNLNDPLLQSQLFGQKDHVRIYALNNYIERLRSAGFAVQIIQAEDLSLYKSYAIQENECFLEITKSTFE